MTQLRDEAFQDVVDRKRRARMDAIDRLPADLRELVHLYGFNVVNTMQLLGVTKANQIKHAVETVLDEFSPTRGSFSSQGIRTTIIAEDGEDANKPSGTAPSSRNALSEKSE